MVAEEQVLDAAQQLPLRSLPLEQRRVPVPAQRVGARGAGTVGAQTVVGRDRRQPRARIDRTPGRIGPACGKHVVGSGPGCRDDRGRARRSGSVRRRGRGRLRCCGRGHGRIVRGDGLQRHRRRQAMQRVALRRDDHRGQRAIGRSAGLADDGGVAVRQAFEPVAVQPPDVVDAIDIGDQLDAGRPLLQALHRRRAAQQGLRRRVGMSEIELDDPPVAGAAGDHAEMPAIGRGGEIDQVGAVLGRVEHLQRLVRRRRQANQPRAAGVELQRRDLGPGLHCLAQMGTVGELLQPQALQPVDVVCEVERVADIGLGDEHAAGGVHADPGIAVDPDQRLRCARRRQPHQMRCVQPVVDDGQQRTVGQRGDRRHAEHRAEPPRAQRLGLAQQRCGARIDLLRQVGEELVPQHIHRLAGHLDRVAAQPRHDVAAVLLDIGRNLVGPVAAGEELEEVGAVEVFLGQRQRAAVGVDLGQLEEAARALGTQPGVEDRAVKATAAGGRVALVVDRQALGHPAGLEQVGDEPGHAAEDGLQHARHAAHLVEMHGVGELVHQQQVEPGAVVEQLAFVGRGQEHADQVEGQRRREAVRKVDLGIDDELGARTRLPVQGLRDSRIDALGRARHGFGLRALRGAVMDAEMRAVGGLPGHARVGQQLRPRRRRRQRQQQGQHHGRHGGPGLPCRHAGAACFKRRHLAISGLVQSGSPCARARRSLRQ